MVSEPPVMIRWLFHFWRVDRAFIFVLRRFTSVFALLLDSVAVSWRSLQCRLVLLPSSGSRSHCRRYETPRRDRRRFRSRGSPRHYDRLCRISVKPARLRIFLFPFNQKANSRPYEFKEAKPEGNWFIDALNPVQLLPVDVSSTPEQVNSEPVNPDFLFGFDKATSHQVSDSNHVAANLSDLDQKPNSGATVPTFESKIESAD